MQAESLFRDHFPSPTTFLAFSLGERLRQYFPDSRITEVSAWEFDFENFAADGHCQIEVNSNWPLRRHIVWSGESSCETIDIGCWTVQWNGQTFQIVRGAWDTSCGGEQIHWILSKEHGLANTFFSAVCKWAEELRQVVLCFSGGGWHRSRKLYQAIQETHLDSLIFPENFRDTVVSDFERFLNSQEHYHSFGASWKRGVLLTGPPGNGKTHFIRALINHLKIPCFYVKSFEMRDEFASTGIQYVYKTVRRTRPCVLVLEDLDSLIDDSNRSYFLNELDGFESNDGIITIATTNHPERLDSAILERPSRFDQKWNFELPGLTERRHYFEAWNRKLPDDSRLTKLAIDTISQSTQRFSYAFLKELCLGSIMKWVQDDSPESLIATMEGYRQLLVQQSPGLGG